MKEAANKSLYAYWNALRGDRKAPQRLEIEPSRIASHLPDTFILERIDSATLVFRLAGSRVVEAMGAELRGKNFFELFDARDFEALRDDIDTVTESGAVSVFMMSADNADGFQAQFEIIVMPLVHMGDRIERFIGAVVAIDRPNWLGSVTIPNRRLAGRELVWPPGAKTYPIAVRGRSVPPALKGPSRIFRSKRLQLRVYDGGLDHGVDKI
jgi:hypothetical protein